MVCRADEPAGAQTRPRDGRGIAILNVKIRAEENSLLRGMDGVLPAYHMNKEHWVSLCLDMLPDATLLDLLADSYDLTRAKMRRASPPNDFL